MTMLRSLFVLATLSIAAVPAAAQDYDGSIGYGGGGIWFSDFNAGSPGASAALDPGWVATGHIEHWVNRGRFGGRVNAAFTRRPLETLGDPRAIHTWIIGGDLLLRVASPSPSRGFAPFIAAGAGIVSYGFGEGPEVFVDEYTRYPGDTDRKVAVSGGLGFDIIPDFTIFGTPAAFRLEAIDHVVLESPFESRTPDSFDPVHNVRVSLEVLGLVRLLR